MKSFKKLKAGDRIKSSAAGRKIHAFDIRARVKTVVNSTNLVAIYVNGYNKGLEFYPTKPQYWSKA